MTTTLAVRAFGAKLGLANPAQTEIRALRLQSRWRWPTLAALLVTIPAFYIELVAPGQVKLAAVLYGAAALVLALALAHVARATHQPQAHLRANWLAMLLIVGLALCAALPQGEGAPGVLTMRLAVAVPTLVHIVWTMQRFFSRGSVLRMLGLALAVLVLAGVGFWWLEPRAHTLGDGMWLAFTTAATVGYGDIVPTTAASKIFSVFVVLLGYGVLSLVTAAIAAMWVESDERRIEREILRDLHQQLRAVRDDLATIRQDIASKREPM
jgi:voltage-gated potassium channel